MEIRDLVNFDPDEAREYAIDIPEHLLDFRQQRDNVSNDLRLLKNRLDQQEALVRKDLRENPEKFGFVKTKKPTISDANDVVTLSSQIITLRDKVNKLEYELECADTNVSIVYKTSMEIDKVLANTSKEMNVGGKYKGSIEERRGSR